MKFALALVFKVSFICSNWSARVIPTVHVLCEMTVAVVRASSLHKNKPLNLFCFSGSKRIFAGIEMGRMRRILRLCTTHVHWMVIASDHSCESENIRNKEEFQSWSEPETSYRANRLWANNMWNSKVAVQKRKKHYIPNNGIPWICTKLIEEINGVHSWTIHSVSINVNKFYGNKLFYVRRY